MKNNFMTGDTDGRNSQLQSSSAAVISFEASVVSLLSIEVSFGSVQA